MGGGQVGAAAQEALLRVVGEHDRGVLVTLRRGGRAQLSNVNYAWDPGSRVLRVSITDGRAKARNLARDPRASFHVTSADGWTWTVVDGVAELTPVAEDPHDATVEELIEVYRAIRGEHPDWDEYRASMVADRRLVVRLSVDHVYGQLPQG
ncbi:MULTISPECIES: PPOX class F420-dependent oxidoreductase [unclassified Streptomyces]|uniref:PPOX class F420-dependent oxidoreductase n=1 Tax=unclassified Streptomyces TaxID=2593676 RepID=UPI002DD9F529|nr:MULTISPECIES: PPOX class F420-dependent oxidoreductase [unclassified Streptomyces]WSA93817.1 PPOX class F420-dependent oxidoreductase [Streptomyces sp. NBC_01795]WSB78187.1 PPOX class F420-dependent oxidoreductase [Streptomyces sp. NBC_01775]WSS13561.1 PPOX class F420-dependent oxidoreductase [Streptomyces sp. NBC_01186]WSS42356.1 PPOX class F420-dependent oxidoreductase [Streptomyces sp. NBC_01187]